MDNVMALQAAIKQQAEDLREELSSLSQWESEIQRNDDAIKSKTVLPADLPPIRGTPKESSAAAAKAKPRVDPVAEAKDQGNEYFKKNQWDDAIRCYTRGIDLDPKSPATHVLYSNRAMCFLKLQKWALAESDASMCIDLNKSFPKGFFRRAVARRALGKLNEARKDLEIVLVLAPGDVEADREIQAVTAEIKARNAATPATGAAAAPAKKKIVIQEVDDDDDEPSQPSASPSKESDAQFEATRKAHEESVRQAQLAAEQKQREAAKKEELKRQNERKVNPRVQVVEEDDEEPAPKKPAAAPRHADPTPAPTPSVPKTAPAAAPTRAPSTRSLDLRAPKSFTEFERTLMDVKNDSKSTDQYVALIDGATFPALVGISLTSELLTLILTSLSRQSAEKAAEVIRGIAGVKRLEEIVMFFEDHETAAARAALAAAKPALSAAEVTKLGRAIGAS